MEELKERLKRELKHAMDNLEGLDPLQVGYKELAESIAGLTSALRGVTYIIRTSEVYDGEVTETEKVEVVETKEETLETKEETKEETLETLETLETKEEEPAVEETKEVVEEQLITKEDLRAVLKECSALDKSLLPKLLAEFGASRLSDVSDTDYRALYDLAKSKLGEV